MGANQSLNAGEKVPVDVIDTFELVEFNKQKTVNEVANEMNNEIVGDGSSTIIEHGGYDSQDSQDELPELYTDSDMPNFKDQNRRRRENKIYRKRNKYIIKYNLTDINTEVESRLQQIIHMRSFNELETYIRSFVLHNKSVVMYDHRR